MIFIFRTRKKTKIFTIIAVILLIIAAILYKLADRYLIEHVEVKVTSPPSITQSSGSPGSSDSSSESTSGSSTPAASKDAEYDDWNYKDDNETISIKKVETGSGSDLITYYVADVTFNGATNLLTAFAKDSFGTNIIQNTSTIASDHQAVFAINGDYYGFRSDGVVIRNGTVYRDEPARTGLALFNDGTMKSYDEKKTSTDDLLAQGVTNAFSFGPALVTDGEIAGDFSHVEIDKNFGNRSIQESNPRTGIGMISANHYLFVIVDGRSNGYSRGMTLTEFADLFKELGATEAYNLDGGGSSTMYFMGRVVNNPLGKGNERGVSDIIYIPTS
ncbi:phosphodiester glycosidase family protein [Paenibacillus glycanilyticus]|uniref:Exopolysaccharide biosynthesis protein n=1 Tax=Paenibacillus glycanilyticus TaxID=126569 RepID=A0ABQ6GKH1_9BACL|nr:phosphodiester glycosidase family protein [Paenibacillus glycanilyticus]GLX69858.1 exopolysaccharide biosynthesis protein [Paenibacillus glycanilyticus]